MLRISNVEVYGMKESLIASGYPMTTKIPQHKYDQDLDDVISENLSRGISLGNSKQGSGHGNFSKGIIVQFDVKYPEYISPEMQRYHWFEIVSSQSKMHRLTKMDIKKSCNKYVDDGILKILNLYVEDYNKDASYENFMKVLSNCPLGLEKTMRISTNYLQLKTMYYQRFNHKLKEDWCKFCAWCESLTYFVDMCLNGQRKFTNEKGEPLNEEFDWRM